MSTRRQSGSFQVEESVFIKSTYGITKNYHEVILLPKFYRLSHKLGV